MKNKHSLALSIFVSLAFFTAHVFSQREHPSRPTETGGPLIFEQAAYDVHSYDISLRIDPARKWIGGSSTMTAVVVIPTNVVVLDLDVPYQVTRISEPYGLDTAVRDLEWERRGGKLWISYPLTKQAGEEITIIVEYSGEPRVAPNPPWIGGFMWTKTPSGAEWISIAMQNDGADLLFPVKDHPSDKPSVVTMNVTVPDPLVAAGPGRLVKTVKNTDGTSTFNWRMTNPIPNYEVLFNAAPYRVIKDRVKSITGEMIPIEFYILPESFEKGAKLIEETKKYNAFFEKYLGPFPFRSQKLGIVETPHLGMEHSTLIAYGNKFRYNQEGYDWLMLHEFGHEWWANLVTASDWRDFWIHEGFQSFMDTLYLEHLGKKDAYFAGMKNRAKNTLNVQPVAPREAKYSYEVYLLGPDHVKSNGDIYGKGAVVLHTLRYLIGDDAFFRALRRMAYPTKQMERFTDGRQTRLVNTDDFLTIAEAECKCELDWFFEVYLRQPKLPRLAGDVVGGALRETLSLRWETPINLPFPMPVEILIDGKRQRVEMPNGRGSIRVGGSKYQIDPDGWILKEP